MKFADLAPGRSITLGPETITESEIVEFARAYDPQWFHVDPERAARSTWQGLVASGWHTCSVAMRMVVDHVLAGSESFGSPGLSYLKWENPVRPGDKLYLTIDVKERRVARSRPTLGIVRWRWRVSNQLAAVVLDLEATSLFEISAETAAVLRGMP
ncbi:MAG: MaoC family dehydratase [Betaproteobacteria bacterium]|nr:MAG: MaoC family dehydratase [Betaproteobacteria bacterium]